MDLKKVVLLEPTPCIINGVLVLAVSTGYFTLFWCCKKTWLRKKKKEKVFNNFHGKGNPSFSASSLLFLRSRGIQDDDRRVRQMKSCFEESAFSLLFLFHSGGLSSTVNSMVLSLPNLTFFKQIAWNLLLERYR